MRKGYVYNIRNTVNGKWYCGSTINEAGNRWGGHKKSLVKGDHRNYKMQADWNEYGEDVFIVENHKTFDTEQECRDYEQTVINEHLGKDDFYNISPDTYKPPTGKKKVKKDKYMPPEPNTLDGRYETYKKKQIPN